MGNSYDVLRTTVYSLQRFDPCLPANGNDAINILKIPEPAEDPSPQGLSRGDMSDSNNGACGAEASEVHAEYDDDIDLQLAESDTASYKGIIAYPKDANITSDNGIASNNEATEMKKTFDKLYSRDNLCHSGNWKEHFKCISKENEYFDLVLTEPSSSPCRIFMKMANSKTNSQSDVNTNELGEFWSIVEHVLNPAGYNIFIITVYHYTQWYEVFRKSRLQVMNNLYTIIYKSHTIQKRNPRMFLQNEQYLF